MKHIVVCLFISLSLMLAPLAQAAGLSCTDADCTHEQLAKKQDSKAEAGQHCCCHHQVAPAVTGSVTIRSLEYIASYISHDDALASITVGPLLEPPSLA